MDIETLLWEALLLKNVQHLCTGVICSEDASGSQTCAMPKLKAKVACKGCQRLVNLAQTFSSISHKQVYCMKSKGGPKPGN